MEGLPADNLLAIVDRLAKLEGLILGLQSTISQGQNHAAASIAKVERLEQRQIELERLMATKDDMVLLGSKVDSLIQSEATRKGSASTASWTLTNLVQWIALLLSLLALVGVGVNRETLQQQDQQGVQGR